MKVKSIMELELLKIQKKKIESLLGATSYYKKFVRNNAKVAQSITQYLKKDKKVATKDSEYINSFEKLKRLLAKTLVLRYPDFIEKLKLITDASNFAIGAVFQHYYASRTLNDYEKITPPQKKSFWLLYGL